jgi:hypothetical protein
MKLFFFSFPYSFNLVQIFFIFFSLFSPSVFLPSSAVIFLFILLFKFLFWQRARVYLA